MVYSIDCLVIIINIIIIVIIIIIIICVYFYLICYTIYSRVVIENKNNANYK